MVEARGDFRMATAESKVHMSEFTNEPFVDFSKPENKRAMEAALKKVEAAAKGFETWKREPAEKRVEMVFRAAEIIRERKFEISALICAEVGKSWIEADADTAETIDFLEFYGREMLRFAGQHPVTPMKGEKNYLVYIPMGVGVVIPPWNFPAAIAAGMTAAA